MRRIRADLMFEKDSEADEVWVVIKKYLKEKKIRNIANEKSFIKYEDCHHDENPPRPCEIIERFEK